MFIKEKVTLIIITYNHEEFIGQCIDSALAQTYDPLEIFIWDNCSTDRTIDVIKKHVAGYHGKHQIVIHESSCNLYPGFGFINTALKKINSKFIVWLSGDDISSPERVEKLVLARKNNGASVLSSSYVEIDENGSKGDYVSTLLRRNRTAVTTLKQFIVNGGGSACVGCGLAFDKKIFDHFGPLRDGPRNADVVIPFRGTLLSHTYYVDEPLVYRRVHNNNIDLKLHRYQSGNKNEMMLLKERQLSNRIANWITILEDYDFFIRKMKDRNKEFEGIRELLLERIEKVTRRWVKHRHQMMMDGVGIV